MVVRMSWGMMLNLMVTEIKVQKINPIARFLMMARDRRRMIPDKKKYNKKKVRQQKYDMHDTRRRNNTQGED